MAGQLSVQ